MSLPVNTQPLEKSFRTGEGILVYATNVLLAVTAVLPHGLSWTHAGLYLTILNAVHVLSRTLLKASAVQQGIGIGAPVDFDPIDPAVVAGVVSDIANVGVLNVAGDAGVAGVAEESGPEVTSKPESALTPDPVPQSAAPADALPQR